MSQDEIDKSILNITTVKPEQPIPADEPPWHSWDDCEDEDCELHKREWLEYEEPEPEAEVSLTPEPIEPGKGGGLGKIAVAVVFALLIGGGAYVLLRPQKVKDTWRRITADQLTLPQCVSRTFQKFPFTAGQFSSTGAGNAFSPTTPCVGIVFGTGGPTTLTIHLEGRNKGKEKWIAMTEVVNPQHGYAFAGPSAPEMRLVCTNYVAGAVQYQVHEQEP